MQKFWYILVTFVVLSLPAFASAQDSTRDRLAERAREVEIDGQPYYRVRALQNEPYLNLLTLAASGTTEEQFDEINARYVNYACRINGRRRVPPTRSGRMVDGELVRIDFVTFASERCAEGTASRELVAGAAYLIPRAVIRTPGEELSAITAQITEADIRAAPGVIADTRDAANAAISRGGISPSIVTAYTDAVTGVLGATTAVRTVVRSPSPPTEDLADELAAAHTRIDVLESELADARNATTSPTPYWIAIVILGLLLLGAMALILFRGSRTIDLTDSQRNLALLNARKGFEKELGGTIEDVKDRIAALTRRLDTAEAWKKSILEVFEKATGKSQATVNEIGDWIKTQQAFYAPWAPYLTKLTPEKFRDERIEAAEYRKIREEWTTTPRFNLAFSLENLSQVIAGWMRFGQLQTMWAGLVPAYAVDASASDGGLQTFLKAQIDEAIRGPVQQRQAAEDEATTLRRELEAERAKPSGFVLDPLRDLLHEIDAGELGSVLKREGRERVIDAEKVQKRFSTERIFEKKGKRGQPPERQVIHQLNALALTDFLRAIHEDFSKALRLVDQMLGRAPDLTPPPGSVAVPVIGDPSAERPQGLGTADLAEQEEGETSELSPEAQAIAAAQAFRDAQADAPAEEGEPSAEEDEIKGEETYIGKPPLGPGATNPFGPGISVRPTSGNGAADEDGHDDGSNGKHRDDETTKVVHLDGEGRKRRDTIRGLAAAPSSEEGEAARAPTDPPPAGE